MFELTQADRPIRPRPNRRLGQVGALTEVAYCRLPKYLAGAVQHRSPDRPGVSERQGSPARQPPLQWDQAPEAYRGPWQPLTDSCASVKGPPRSAVLPHLPGVQGQGRYLGRSTSFRRVTPVGDETPAFVSSRARPPD